MPGVMHMVWYFNIIFFTYKCVLYCPHVTMENILVTNNATYLHVTLYIPCLSWSLTNSKYPSNQPCNIPLHVSFPCLSVKVRYKRKISLGPYNQPCNIPLHVSLPCLSGKVLQMENIFTTNRATSVHVSLLCPYGKFLQMENNLTTNRATYHSIHVIPILKISLQTQHSYDSKASFSPESID